MTPVNRPVTVSRAATNTFNGTLSAAGVDAAISSEEVNDALECRVRSRIPVPGGGADIFMHLYRHRGKTTAPDDEHYAFVCGAHIRSRQLQCVADEQERLLRGVHVDEGLSQSEQHARLPPLVRIHSACFTGEVMHSQRCDCGEQLDLAMQMISDDAAGGVIVYLRQEGRGIGLEEKLKAYNLQDMGYDTVQANLMLSHPADLRDYSIGARILHDLGITDVRLLTNNPDKIEQLGRLGVRVVERVPLVVHAVRRVATSSTASSVVADSDNRTSAGATTATSVIDRILRSTSSSPSARVRHSDTLSTVSMGSSAEETPPHPEMLAYLRTKVKRMRHIIDLPDGEDANDPQAEDAP